MTHIRIDADQSLLPFYEHLYNDKKLNFVLQHGAGPHFMVSTHDNDVIKIASEEKGAVELDRIHAQIEFQNMNGYSLIGNETLIWII